MTFPNTKHVASVGAPQGRPEVRIYRVIDDSHTPPHYYWCCETDGACGRHRRDMQTSTDEASLHLQTHQEAHNGQE